MAALVLIHCCIALELLRRVMTTWHSLFRLAKYSKRGFKHAHAGALMLLATLIPLGAHAGPAFTCSPGQIISVNTKVTIEHDSFEAKPGCIIRSTAGVNTAELTESLTFNVGLANKTRGVRSIVINGATFTNAIMQINTANVDIVTPAGEAAIPLVVSVTGSTFAYVRNTFRRTVTIGGKALPAGSSILFSRNSFSGESVYASGSSFSLDFDITLPTLRDNTTLAIVDNTFAINKTAWSSASLGAVGFSMHAASAGMANTFEVSGSSLFNFSGNVVTIEARVSVSTTIGIVMTGILSAYMLNLTGGGPCWVIENNTLSTSPFPLELVASIYSMMMYCISAVWIAGAAVVLVSGNTLNGTNSYTNLWQVESTVVMSGGVWNLANNTVIARREKMQLAVVTSSILFSTEQVVMSEGALLSIRGANMTSHGERLGTATSVLMATALLYLSTASLMMSSGSSVVVVDCFAVNSGFTFGSTDTGYGGNQVQVLGMGLVGTESSMAELLMEGEGTSITIANLTILSNTTYAYTETAPKVHGGVVMIAALTISRGTVSLSSGAEVVVHKSSIQSEGVGFVRIFTQVVHFESVSLELMENASITVEDIEVVVTCYGLTYDVYDPSRRSMRCDSGALSMMLGTMSIYNGSSIVVRNIKHIMAANEVGVGGFVLFSQLEITLEGWGVDREVDVSSADVGLQPHDDRYGQATSVARIVVANCTMDMSTGSSAAGDNYRSFGIVLITSSPIVVGSGSLIDIVGNNFTATRLMEPWRGNYTTEAGRLSLIAGMKSCPSYLAICSVSGADDESIVLAHSSLVRISGNTLSIGERWEVVCGLTCSIDHDYLDWSATPSSLDRIGPSLGPNKEVPRIVVVRNSVSLNMSMVRNTSDMGAAERVSIFRVLSTLSPIDTVVEATASQSSVPVLAALCQNALNGVDTSYSYLEDMYGDPHQYTDLITRAGGCDSLSQSTSWSISDGNGAGGLSESATLTQTATVGATVSSTILLSLSATSTGTVAVARTVTASGSETFVRSVTQTIHRSSTLSEEGTPSPYPTMTIGDSTTATITVTETDGNVSHSVTSSPTISESETFSLQRGCPTHCLNMTAGGGSSDRRMWSRAPCPDGAGHQRGWVLLNFSDWRHDVTAEEEGFVANSSGAYAPDSQVGRVFVRWNGTIGAIQVEATAPDSSAANYTLVRHAHRPGETEIVFRVRYGSEEDQRMSTATIHASLLFSCFDSAPVPIAIRLGPPPPPIPVLSALVEAAATVASIFGAAAGAPEMQTLALLGLSACAKGAAKASGTALRAVAPAAISDTCEGAIYGNAITLVAALVLNGCFVVFKRVKRPKRKKSEKKKKGDDGFEGEGTMNGEESSPPRRLTWLEACDAAKFPTYFLKAAMFLQKGFLLCGLEVVRDERPTAAPAALGYAAIIWTVVPIALFGVIGFVLATRAYYPLIYSRLPRRWRHVASVMLPAGQLDKAVVGTEMYGVVVGKLQHPQPYLVFIAFSSFVASAPVLLGVGGLCPSMYWISVGIHVVGGIYLMAGCPFRVIFGNVSQSAGMLLSAALVTHYVLMLDDPYDVSDEFRSSLGAFATVQTVVTYLRLATSGLTLVYNKLASSLLPHLKPFVGSCSWEYVGYPYPKVSRGASRFFTPRSYAGHEEQFVQVLNRSIDDDFDEGGFSGDGRGVNMLQEKGYTADQGYGDEGILLATPRNGYSWDDSEVAARVPLRRSHGARGQTGSHKDTESGVETGPSPLPTGAETDRVDKVPGSSDDSLDMLMTARSRHAAVAAAGTEMVVANRGQPTPDGGTAALFATNVPQAPTANECMGSPDASLLNPSALFDASLPLPPTVPTGPPRRNGRLNTSSSGKSRGRGKGAGGGRGDGGRLPLLSVGSWNEMDEKEMGGSL